MGFFTLFQQINARLKHQPGYSLHLQFDDFDRFQCSKCSQCCKLPWRVLISKEHHTKWAKVLSEHPSGRFKNAFTVVNENNEIDYANITHKPNSTDCTFLDDDGLCFLHKNYGEDAKPIGCRLYPMKSGGMGYKYSFSTLMGSCRTVPSMWLDEPELIYKLDPKPRLKEEKQPLVQQEVHMNIYAFHLWIALVLDTLIQSQNTAVQNLHTLNYPLHLLTQATVPPITEPMIDGIYQAHISRQIKGFRHPPPDTHKATALYWFITLSQNCEIKHIGRFYKEIYEGRRQFISFKSTEKRMLDRFLRNYLLHECIVFNYMTFTNINIFQQHLVFAINVTILQLITYYFRVSSGELLNINHLRTAVNLLDSRITQNSQWINQSGINNMSAYECLENIAFLMSIDLCSS